MSVVAPFPTLSAPPQYVTNKVLTTSPRVVAVIYGARVVPLDVRVTYSGLGVSDTATLKLGGGYNWGTFLKSPTDDGSVIVEVYAGFPTNPPPNSTDISQLQQIFLGLVEHYEHDEPEDEWTFECSSLATLLTAEKQTTLIANQTTVQYIQALASELGLQTDIRLAPGQSPITLQQVFAQDFVVGVKNVRPWGVLQSCAEAEDMELSLRFGTLRYWSPIYTSNPPQYPIQYGADLVTCKGTHSPQFNKNIQVEVRTYQAKTTHVTRYGPKGVKSSTTVTTPVFGSGGSIVTTDNGTSTTTSVRSASGGFFNTGALSIPGASSKEHIVIHKDGLTKDQADAFALAEWKRRSRQEYRMQFSMPVTPDLLKVLDQDLAFPLSGYPDPVFNSNAAAPYYRQQRTTQTISLQDGYLLEVEGINHQIEVESAV